MKTFPRFFIIVFIIFIIITPSSNAAEFLVTRIIDGDTIVATSNDITIMVRLIAIDAPELPRKKGEEGQPFSQQAKMFLINLILNKTVEIKGNSLDKYNRLLGVVSLEGKSINLEIIKNGLAEVHYNKLPSCIDIIPYLAAERAAREALKGIWSLGDDYISPSDWCKMH